MKSDFANKDWLKPELPPRPTQAERLIDLAAFIAAFILLPMFVLFVLALA